MPLEAALSANPALALQFLAWVDERPRTYAEAMDAWRTSCPRMTVWEDCRDAGLVSVRASPGGLTAAAVELTETGAALLGGAGRP